MSSAFLSPLCPGPTPTIASVFFDQARQSPVRIALIAGEETWSYSRLAQSVSTTARAFQRLGADTRQPIGLLLWNTPHWVMTYLALAALGIPVVPLNPALTPAELAQLITLSQIAWLVTDAAGCAKIDPASHPTLRGMILTDSTSGEYAGACRSWQAFLAAAEPATQTKPEAGPQTDAQPDRPAVILFTSGTTGTPKGVMLSHANLLADARANAEILALTPADRLITISPLFHVFGQVNVLLSALIWGASVVLIAQFHSAKALQAMTRYRVTLLIAVPTMYQQLLEALSREPCDLGAIRLCHSGAAPMPAPLLEAIERRIGAPVQEGYGLSEASSIVTSNPLAGPRKIGSVGRPLPGVSLRICDDAGRQCGPLEPGEVQVNGPIVFQGYFAQPELTQSVLSDGWLKTGDQGYLDEAGYLFLLGRRDDVINHSGSKVYPAEIEAVLLRHPNVAEVAVVGVPSPKHHQVAQAFIVPVDPRAFSKRELLAFCRAFLAPFKVPYRYRCVASIPKTASGKIRRNLLRVSPQVACPKPVGEGVSSVSR